MSSSRNTDATSRIRRTLDARKWARGKVGVLCVLGALVTFGVAGLLMQNVMAAKTKVRVLDCPVTEVVAHHHNADCYDESGELVCTLPERDVHKHDESCYERQLVCGKQEGEGHKHGKDCYDSDGNLTCKLEESEAHKHTDDCYADILACGKDEVSTEHVHGAGCFHVVSVGDDADQTIQPEQFLLKDVKDADDNYVMTVAVDVPEGALPEGTTMEATLVDADKIDREMLQSTIDDKAAKLESLEPGKLLTYQAVDITFHDSEGASIEPKTDVNVRLTSDLVSSEDSVVVMHLAEKKDSKGEKEAQFVDTLSDKQLIRRSINLSDDQIAFDASSFSEYVLATVSKRYQQDLSDGGGLSVTFDAPAEAGIPQHTALKVTEVGRDEAEYDEYLNRTAEATQIDADSVGLARFFDISIYDANDNEIQPQAPVDVQIVLPEIPAEPTDFKLVHFAEDGQGKQSELPEEVAAGGENGTTTFTAESFSVYGIIYTVDFGYQVGDKVYDFTINGGDSVAMYDVVDMLHIYENAPEKYQTAELFSRAIQNVEFSNTDFVLPKYIEERASVKDILERDGLNPEFAAGTTEEDRAAANAKEYERDWVLFSLKPFSTVEMLTITLEDGTQYLVKVTDDQSKLIPDGQASNGQMKVRSANNPGSTTIDLFDYYVSYTPEQAHNQQLFDRMQWQGKHNYDEFGYDQHDGLNGWGNGQGINDGHSLKFTPANDNTVRDAEGQANSDQRGNRINDYTGNANPTQGLVQNKLVNGYPVLSGQKGGQANQSLAYLFDSTDDSQTGSGYQAGKRAYMDVNKLLYQEMDDNDYYKYDSNEVWAQFDPSKNEFELSVMPGNYQGSQRGFWPFQDGYHNWWAGMHVNTTFMQPPDGMINGGPMKFEFSGDDDAWVFIDDVLIGDGGGIHNGTKIKIDFATGLVTVTGHDDPRHYGGFEETKTIGDYFRSALGESADTEARLQDLNGDGRGDTLKFDSAHVFDFFYLERGGAESNLFLHYNLLSTTDFQGRKIFSSEDQSAVQEDQFGFIFAGLYGRYDRDEYGNCFLVDGTIDEPAIMPQADDNGFNGTAHNPSLVRDYEFEFNDGIHGTAMRRASIYTTGNLAGSSGIAPIQFGKAVIPESAKAALEESDPNHPPRYHYYITERIPDSAVNGSGRTYGESTIEERNAGGYYDGNILYSNKVYYLEYTLTKQQDGPNPNAYRYVLTPTWYKDINFTVPDTDAQQGTMDVNFENQYVTPLDFEIKKESEDGIPLKGAKFQLGFGRYNEVTKKWEWSGNLGTDATSDENGKVTFGTGLAPGYYLLRETEAPAGYKLPEKMWVLKMEKVNNPPHIEPAIKLIDATGDDDQWDQGFVSKSDEVIVNQQDHSRKLSTTITNEEVDKYKLIVQKQWKDMDGRDTALAQSEVEVQIGRYYKTTKTAALHIIKQGVPENAQTVAFYTINKVVDEGLPTEHEERVAIRPNLTWGADDMDIEVIVPAKSVADGGTKYRVYETIFSDDPHYTATHNPGTANPQEVTVYHDDASNNEVTFTAQYVENKGHLYLKTTLTDTRTGTNLPAIDTSKVKYDLYDETSTLVDSYTYDQVMQNYDPDKGFDLGERMTGRYALVESGWPDLADADETHYPPLTINDTSLSIHDLSLGGEETFIFTTTYANRRTVPVYVWGYHKGDINSLVLLKTENVAGSQATITFTAMPGATDYTVTPREKSGDHVIAGSYYNRTDYDITWDPITSATTPTQGSFIIDIPPTASSVTVCIGTDDGTLDADSGQYSPAINTLITNVSAVEYVAPTNSGNGGNAGGDSNASGGDSGNNAGGEGANNTNASTKSAVARALEKSAESNADDESDEAYGRQGMEYLNKGVDSVDDELSNAGAISLAKAAGAKAGGSLRSSNTFTPQTSKIKPGNYWVPGPDEFAWLYWDGNGRPQDSQTEMYVDDTEFNQHQYTVVLSQADTGTEVLQGTWTKTIEDVYPAKNDDGDNYYYYIAAVREANMPKGTEVEIVKDGTNQIVSTYIDADHDPVTLPVANTVAAPTDVEVVKVDANDHTQLAGAVFHLEAKDDHGQWTTVTDVTVKVRGGTADVTVDPTTGQFTVPQDGVVLKDIYLGEYKLVEDSCPPGYVMNQTEYEFQVDQAGIITSSYKTDPTDDDCITLDIPNPPGAELPHAGGIGTTLFSVAGVMLMVAGATMLLKRRREA